MTCSSLSSVTIGDSVTSIGDYVFAYCDGLTSVAIPNSVTSIGLGAFQSCSSLTSITIPNSVTSIGEYAFSGCNNISSATMPTLAISSIPQDSLQEVVLTSGERIEDYAFDGCSSLTTVTIPDSVTSIGEWAFYGCYGLTSVTIGEGVTRIGVGAFLDCSNLELVCITDIEAWCKIDFEGGDSNPLIVGNNACLYLNGEPINGEIIIPDDVTALYDGIFRNCTGLTYITIPDSVSSIGSDAFAGCTNVIKKDNGVSYVDGWMIDCDTYVTSVVLREGTRGIADFAFYNCTGLTSVTIPDSVTSIGFAAFYDCSSLTSVTFENTSGWQVSKSNDFSSYTALSSDDLSDASTAANYLQSTYYNYYWRKV